jgi:alanine racemase
MSRAATGILSEANLIHNLTIIKSHANKAKIIAMVKANAYGHGLRSTSLKLQNHVDMLGVASIDEAIALRKSGVHIPILLAEGAFEPSEILVASEENFHIVFHHKSQIEWLRDSDITHPINAWLKINTGMGRLGFNLDEASDSYEELYNSKKTAKPLKIMSHFACADDKTHTLNFEQIATFQSFINRLDAEYSICNSAGIFNFPECHYDYVRPGISLYGASPLSGINAADLGLKPVMTLQTNLISVNLFKKGQSVGYGSCFSCPEDMLVGIAAFGYGDGYPRSAKNFTPLIVHGKRCHIIGRVSMDMIAIDLRNSNHAKVGDLVTLWGEDLSVEEVASYTGNINYDILTGIQNRVKFTWI